MSSLDKLDTFIKEQKIYLKPGEKAPEGVKVFTGKKYGKYYLSSGREEKQKIQPQQEENTKVTNDSPKLDSGSLVYHGTAEAYGKSIMQEGLKISKTHPGCPKAVYASRQQGEAFAHATNAAISEFQLGMSSGKYTEKDIPNLKVILITSDKKNFPEEAYKGEDNTIIKRDIDLPPSLFKKVEVYKIKDAQAFAKKYNDAKYSGESLPVMPPPNPISVIDSQETIEKEDKEDLFLGFAISENIDVEVSSNSDSDVNTQDKDVQRIYDLLSPKKKQEEGNNNNYTFSDQKNYNNSNNGEKEMKKAKTNLEKLNEFVKSEKPLVEKTIWITNFKGTKFPKKIWVDPETGERRLNTKNKVVTRTGEKEDKSKIEEKKKQIDYKEAQNIQEKLARQERAEESGEGARAEFGPVSIPWTETHHVKIEDTPEGIRYTGKNGKVVNVKNTVTGFTVYDGNERVGKFIKERDAHEKVKSIFLGEGEKEK